jgi:hypothetical protein
MSGGWSSVGLVLFGMGWILVVVAFLFGILLVIEGEYPRWTLIVAGLALAVCVALFVNVVASA